MGRTIPFQTFRERLLDLIEGEDGPAPESVTGACSDSRAVEAGGVFCAIAGSAEDGRRYIPDAVAAGAAVVVGEGLNPVPGVRTIRVRDAYAAFADAGAEVLDFRDLLPQGFDVLVVEVKVPAHGKALVGNGGGTGPDKQAVRGPVAEIVHSAVLEALAGAQHDQQQKNTPEHAECGQK